MASNLFSPKDLKPEQLNTFIQKVLQLEEKKTIIRNWQKAIANGKVQKSKEEQIKGEFLDKFFGQVLGYSYESHEPEWNLEKEFKSISDNKKPDAALGFFDQKEKNDVRCVIEVKGALNNLDKKQNRADFSGSPVDQAFAYVPRMPGRCEWVIVTNMIEIRLYSRTDIGRYESFQIPELLVPDQLARFFFLLSYQQLFLEAGDSKVDLIFHERVAEQKVIEKEFYNRYHQLRLALFNNLRKQHPTIAPKKLFGLTQKLLDRLLFICFVRDRELLDANRFLNDVQQAVKRSFRKKKEAIWTEMKYFFTAMNEGLAEAERDIPEFNGGLFKEDEELNNLHVLDSQLTEIIHFVSSYNFDSQLDVNILGHIFEQSISDIEEFQSTFDEEKAKAANTGKRKKDGIFYTPEYITRYMVKEAVGGWLEDRKKEILQELKLDAAPVLSAEEIENATVAPSEKVKATLAFLERYREQLKKVKVVDPACGSGAFLNAVFDFLWLEWDVLMKEWNQLTRPWKDQLRDHAVAEPLEVYNGTDEWKIKKAIVANNIYGVDLNPESVEISKLSLWLKTANRKETLADLSGNIKQGNSLIDDPKVAGDDAFDWNHAFAEIMQAGGFDVVVGNPPYSYRNAIRESEKDFFKQNYKSCEGNFDLYKFFIEKSINLSSANGLSCFIVPNTFLSASTYKKLREIILKEFEIQEVYDLGLHVFEDVVVESVIFRFRKGKIKGDVRTRIKIQRNRDLSIIDPESDYLIPITEFEEFNIYLSKENKTVIDKINNESIVLGKICYCTVGINTGYIKEELVSSRKIDNRYHKVLNGKDIGRYSVNWPGDYIMYDPVFVKSKGELGRSLPPEKIFEQEKILVQRTRRGMKRKLVCYFDADGFYNLNRLSNVVLENKDYSLKFIYALLNSVLMDFYFNKVYNEYEVKPIHLAKLPIKAVSKKEQNSIVARAEKMIALHKSVSDQSQKFIDLLRANFVFEPTAKLKKWHTLEFIDVIAELEKGGAKLPPKKQGEWLELFKTEKEKIKTTQNEIDKTDKEIDQLVYALYELTPEEIAIVEKG
ncbi:MAG: N-6 DNA methylase [Chryseotalea sp. WA131a]|nr:MAG: N-6 DNA methylase [Chryseotalea sp. WA131a]